MHLGDGNRIVGLGRSDDLLSAHSWTHNTDWLLDHEENNVAGFALPTALLRGIHSQINALLTFEASTLVEKLMNNQLGIQAHAPPFGSLR